MRYLLPLFISTLFCYPSFSQDIWTEKPSYPALKREGALAFAVNGIVYAGLGWTTENEASAEFKKYDPAMDMWEDPAEFPGEPRFHTPHFVIGEKAYIVSGQGDGTNDAYIDVWEYDTNEDVWTQKADFPGPNRSGTGNFAIDGKGYLVAGHIDGTGLGKETWEYTPETDSWTQKADFPGEGRTKMMSFTINGKGYVGLGGSFFGPFVRDLYEYDPVNDTWVQKADFPLEGMGLMATFVLGDKAYMVAGMIGQNYFTDFVYTYHPATDTWEAQEVFLGTDRHHTSGFTMDNKGYVIFGHSLFGFENSFWEFCPEEISSTDYKITDLPISIGPNPSNGFLTINAEKGWDEISVFDASGKRFLEFENTNFHSGESQIDLSQLANGLYYLEIEMEDRSLVKRILISK